MVDGKGDPNEEGGSYQQAVGLLYGLTFAIKMSRKSGDAPEGYFEYVVPPLEGLWWSEDDLWRGESAPDKSRFCWTSMIRQPEFVTPQVFEWAKGALSKKKPELDLSRAGWRPFARAFACRRCMWAPMTPSPRRWRGCRGSRWTAAAARSWKTGGAITSCTWATRAAPRPSGCAPCCVTR